MFKIKSGISPVYLINILGYYHDVYESDTKNMENKHKIQF